jgi:hypothetical protein
MKCLILGLGCLILVATCEADIIIIPPGSAIQPAIDFAAPGDTLIVLDGVYAGTGNHDIDFKGKAITLTSAYGPENCIIDCGSHRGFVFHSGEEANSVLAGFTITNGHSQKGGALYLSGASPTIENCVITGNRAAAGDAAYGGAIYCTANSNPLVTGCTISDNTVEGYDGVDFGMRGGHAYGGGIYCSADSHPVIDGCVITRNGSAGGDGAGGSTGPGGDGGDACGGGIYAGDVTITNCLITHNTAVGGDAGSGVWAGEGGYGVGAGIFCNGTITNATVTHNTAADGFGRGPGGGMGGGIMIHGSGPRSLKNCILWGNTADDGPQIHGNASVSYCDVQAGFPGTGNIDANPLFASAASGDYHLQSEAGRWDPNSESWVIDAETSLCIDAGNPGCPVGDEPDPNGNRINMGAYGGTAQASKSPDNWAFLADLTNDRKVDANDLRVLVDYWLESGQCLPGDLDRSQSVNLIDYAIFALQCTQIPMAEPSVTYEIGNCDFTATASAAAEPNFTVWVQGRYIHFEDMMYANCCPYELRLDSQIVGNQITLYEIGYDGLCDCMCWFPITATLGPFPDGTYTVEVIDNLGQSLGMVEVTVGAPPEPGISYQIEDCNMEAGASSLAEQSQSTRFTVTVEGQYIHFEDIMVANCCAEDVWLEMQVENHEITIYERETGGICLCICDYPVRATLGPFEPGTYTLEVYEDYGGFIGSTTVTIGPGP